MNFTRVDQAAGVTALRTPSGRFIDVVMDCTQPPFNDKRVREALALTIDRPEGPAKGRLTPVRRFFVVESRNSGLFCRDSLIFGHCKALGGAIVSSPNHHPEAEGE